MYEFEFHYKLKEEAEELWTWCLNQLKDSFYFHPKSMNILDAKYNPMTMIADYGGPIEVRERPHILYISKLKINAMRRPLN